MTYVDKFSLLDTYLKESIIEYAIEHTPWIAATKYAGEVGFSVQGLMTRLAKELRVRGAKGKESIERKVIKNVGGYQKREAINLGPDELELLEKLKKGEVELDEVRRLVASKVFEKMLKYPDDFKFIDFFRTELLDLKRREVETKQNWAMEIVGRMFAGQLPPQICPGCGLNLVPQLKAEALKLEEGELA